MTKELRDRITTATDDSGAVVVKLDGVGLGFIPKKQFKNGVTGKTIRRSQERDINYTISLIASAVQVIDGTHPALNLT